MSRTDAARIAARTANTGKIAICHRGVDQRRFAPAGQRPDRCTRFLFLGRARAEKGADIVEAVAERLSGTDADIRVTIAGEFEPGEHGNRSYRGFVGYDDLPELYRSHDALLLPSRSEGFPTVVIEAMSCGLPAIVSRHLLGEDLDEENGALLVAAEAEAAAEAARRLSGDPALFARLRGAALAHARVQFDEDTNRARYHDALLGKAA